MKRTSRKGVDQLLRLSLIAPIGLAICSLAVLCTISAAAADRPSSRAEPGSAVSAGQDPAEPHQPTQTDLLRTGDKLRLAFYQKFDEPEDKWRGQSRSPDAGFHQFSELCGDYVVQDDGTLSFPILGRFQASGRGRDQLLADVTRSFETLIGKTGFVNVIAMERQPVFVVGAVKNPGAFKYWQGMTVLHAVALAGGAKVQDAETWQRVESGREIDRLQRSLERVKRLLVRTSIMRAEGGGAAVPAEALNSLVGRDATALTSEEQAARRLTEQSQKATAEALGTAVEDAQRNLKARIDRLGPIETLVSGRQDRAKTIAQLVEHDAVARPVLVQTEGDLADAQDRKRQALIEISEAKDRVAEAEHALTKQQTEASIEVARTTQVAERDTEDAVSDTQGALNLVQALAPKGPREGLPDTYEVVRKSESGTEVLHLPGTAPLEPGDLIKLTQGDAVGD